MLLTDFFLFTVCFLIVYYNFKHDLCYFEAIHSEHPIFITPIFISLHYNVADSILLAYVYLLCNNKLILSLKSANVSSR